MLALSVYNPIADSEGAGMLNDHMTLLPAYLCRDAGVGQPGLSDIHLYSANFPLAASTCCFQPDKQSPHARRIRVQLSYSIWQMIHHPRPSQLCYLRPDASCVVLHTNVPSASQASNQVLFRSTIYLSLKASVAGFSSCLFDITVLVLSGR